MNHRLIRSLDAGIGRLICFLLTSHRRMMGSKSDTQRAPRQVLFLKLIEQGASVLAMPAFKQAANLVGRDQIFICVFDENRAILDLLAPCPEANIWTLRSKNVVLFAFDLMLMLRKARRLDIDAVVDLELFSRASAIISYLSGANRRVGLHRFTMEAPYRGDLLTHKVAYNPYLHTAANYLLLVDCLARPASDQPINKLPEPMLPTQHHQFNPTAVDVSEANALLLQRTAGQVPRGPRFILNPNASDLLPLRKWPTPRFIELARQLLAAYPDGLLILSGNDRERKETELMCAAIQSPRLITVAGSTSLRQLLTLFTLSDVLVTNDSGPGHFASMTQIANIVLFGPETPRLYGPISGNARPMSAQLACSPCVNALNHRLSPCTNNRCMQEISVATVLAEIRLSLEGQIPRLAKPA
jgi:ADP-heptose:LPS heptosyltransferase